jgi:ABC-type uncharacterized transport system permease subunit
MNRRILVAVAAPVAAIVFAFVITSIALLASGHQPFEAYGAMWDYASTPNGWVSILNRATPLYVSALAVALGFKMGLFNIGVDGQYRLAALLAAAAGSAVDLPPVIHVPFVILVAVVVGAAWAGIAGLLKVTRNVNEVVATIMLNFIATSVISFLLIEHLRNPDAEIIQTNEIPPSGRIPSLNGLVEALGVDLPGSAVLSSAIIGAAVVGVAYWALVWRTRFGYDLRASGTNATAARAAGVNPKRMVLFTMLISGGIAGLVGMGPLLGDPNYFNRYSIGQFPGDLGFNGIAVALVGRNNPAGAAVAALLFAGLDVSSQNLASVGVPPEITLIMKGTITLAAVIAFEVVRRLAEAATLRAAAQKAEPRPGSPLPAATAGVGA